MIYYEIMTKIDIKLVKFGIIFFKQPASLSYNQNQIELYGIDKELKFSSPVNEIKYVGFNPINGLLTLRAKNRQHCNITFIDSESAEGFQDFLNANSLNNFKP
jgi:hypothetical protein